jgi:hypothetical protein
LLLAGDDIVPFHRLPNPAHDDDREVPTDNLYASTDDEPLVVEQAVGRVPDSTDRDPNRVL